ncbi:hypothetical protein HYW76_03965 [Candidatus Pacearchaeota archaeon]|nr:hypothetical protein [Candidatus Pacearchaeota archaeon]
MAYEYFHPGTPYSLDPNYGGEKYNGVFTGYRMQAGEFGMSTDPRTALQLQEFSNKLNVGIKTMEIEGLQQDVFDSIPKQHLAELNKLSKLTGVATTLHGPLIEASGYTREGWSETNRAASENQLKSTLERAHELSPNGGMPVTFHSTVALPATEEKVKIGEEQVTKSALIVDPRTGEIKQLKEKERYFPGQEGKFEVDNEVKRINEDAWAESVGQVAFYALRGEENIEPPRQLKESISNDKELKERYDNYFKAYAESRTNPQEFEKLPDDIKNMMDEQFKRTDHAALFLRDAYKNLRELYNTAYSVSIKNNSDEGKKNLQKLDSYKTKIEKVVKEGNGIEKNPAKLKEFAEIIQEGVKVLGNISAPQIYQPLTGFLIDKSADSFANAALYSYEKYKDKAPIISIENPPAGSGLSRAEDLKGLIEESRKKFAEQLIDKKGMSKEQANKIAEKTIGATWDVGHINMIRKFGYTKEDVIKEAGIIAPFVKHVHLSDNFGMEHTELPMGMGNVPIKEVMEKLGKAGVDAKKIIEAGNWWQHMKSPPFAQSLEAFGSPVYGSGGPYWNQAANTYGNYFAFPSAYMPEQHFSLYGGGFSSLPTELGGQIPGKQSRVSGAPID